MRILAVDDDPIILEILMEFLSEQKHREVSVAESAGEALALLNSTGQQFDCILLDIQMPGMDGVELCRRIRSLPQYDRTPILMLTAMSEKSYIDSAFSAGASDYITKPFEIVEVEARIRTAEQIVEERRRAVENRLALLSMRKDSEHKDRQLLTDPLTVPDVNGMIEPLAFENYLLQLSRTKKYMSAIIAVKVANVTEIFQECTARNFRFFIEDMADALSDSLGRWRFLMSYEGAGVFVITVDRRDANAVAEGLRTGLPAALYELGPTFDGGLPIPIDIAVGEPCYSGVLKNRSVQTLMRLAIEDVEKKSLRKARVARGVPIGTPPSGHLKEPPDPVSVVW